MRRHLRSKIRSGPAHRLHARHRIRRHRAIQGTTFKGGYFSVLGGPSKEQQARDATIRARNKALKAKK